LLHLANGALLHNLATLVTQDRRTTASLLAHIAEVDERRLYRAAAYDSMFEYCVSELHMSEETAFRRIRVARTAREYPAIFPALADGRLHPTAVLLLTPHLTPGTAAELLAAATHKTKAEIDLLLAERFPKPDVPTTIQPIGVPVESAEPAMLLAGPTGVRLAPEPVVPSVGSNGTLQTQPPAAHAKLAPLAPDRFALQVTISGAARELLRQAQALLGHTVPSGDVAVIIERALEALVIRLEKQKFAKCDRPRPQRGPAKGRHIPAAVRRAVHERDGGQCTFVSENGKRCESRTRLEYDHVEPAARGGHATVSGIRLRCRAHNQYAAEMIYGEELMRARREARRDWAAKVQAERRNGNQEVVTSPA
jgi:5-methylcytosine-specific restriction endonuclease McrA